MEARFRDALDEVQNLDSFITKKDKLGLPVGRKFTDRLKDYEDLHNITSEKIGRGHTLHTAVQKYGRETYHHHIVTNKDNRITHYVTSDTYKDDHPSVLHIAGVASSGTSPIKMHDVYHHLVKRGHILVGSSQSPGGRRIWQQLQKKKDVNIHGWDPKLGKPVNVDLKHGTEETHAGGKEDHYYTHDDYQNKEQDRIQRMHIVAHKK